MSNCKYCKYYGEYNDGKFSFPICKIQIGLEEAAERVKSSGNCKDFNNKFDFTNATAALKATAKAFKKLSKTAKRSTKKMKKQIKNWRH